jgi:predicted RNA-binding Zn-ribbon protein involved in translation (DUF1610 family)
MWKIEKVISKGEYNYMKVKAHPNATKHGYVLEHRIVVENHLNRILDKSEVVHHKNHNKKDNRIENLEVMILNEHATLHAHEHGRKWVKLKCPNCGVIFDRVHNQTHLSKNGKYTCCSKACRGKLSRNIQLGVKTVEVENAISANIQEVYTRFMDNAEETQSQGFRRDYTHSTCKGEDIVQPTTT